jgi:CHAD domain-containing protein
MAGTKWISDLTAVTPLAEAARRALTVRLEVVRDYLPLAVQHADDDPEHVHQLRVASRRARAALDIFSACLPPRVYRSAKKRLRRIRQAAGEARDWDVFLLELAQLDPGNRRRRAGIDFLYGYAVDRRELAQIHLREATTHHPFEFDRFLAETVAAVHTPHDHTAQTLSDLARPLMRELLRELDEAGAGHLDDYEHLHRVRIIGKRVRYAMEIFAGCFAAPFRDEIYPAVEEMQEILGAANDSHVAAGRLSQLCARLPVVLPDRWPRLRPGIENLLRAHERRLPEQRQQFEEWWRRWQKSGGEAMFLDLLQPTVPPDGNGDARNTDLAPSSARPA